VCSFDGVRPDFSTRALNCTTCRVCADVCPAEAIEFGWRRAERVAGGSKQGAPVEGGGRPITRRAWLLALPGGLLAAWGIGQAGGPARKLLRPPGSVSEELFLDLCVRCGECFKVCPGPVLHPSGPADGLDALWTPVAVPVRAGCHPECNFCTQVCPTGAIRPLTLQQKRRTPMGLAEVDTRTCLAFTGECDCRYCFDECEAAGYHAIDMRRIELDVDLEDVPEGTFSAMELQEMRYIEAPFVKREACVGCGLCEYRCHAVNVNLEKRLTQSAVTVAAEADRGA